MPRRCCVRVPSGGLPRELIQSYFWSAIRASFRRSPQIQVSESANRIGGRKCVSHHARVSWPLLFRTRAVIGFQVADGVLDSRQHMRDEGTQGINLFVVAMGFIEDAAIPHALNVTQRVKTPRAAPR